MSGGQESSRPKPWGCVVLFSALRLADERRSLPGRAAGASSPPAPPRGPPRHLTITHVKVSFGCANSLPRQSLFTTSQPHRRRNSKQKPALKRFGFKSSIQQAPSLLNVKRSARHGAKSSASFSLVLEFVSMHVHMELCLKCHEATLGLYESHLVPCDTELAR